MVGGSQCRNFAQAFTALSGSLEKSAQEHSTERWFLSDYGLSLCNCLVRTNGIVYSSLYNISNRSVLFSRIFVKVNNRAERAY